MNTFVESLLSAWRANGDYAQKLVADLVDEQMIIQPQPKMNHPAWILSHLNAYHPVLIGLVRGQTPDDPILHRFGMKSHPEQDASLYGTKEQLIATFKQGHGELDELMQSVDVAVFEKRMPLERWQTRFPKVGSVLGYVMIAHEATHLGQLSVWRRVQGLPSV